MIGETLSFIETQFPVSKVSKESYKERKANNGQTLTGLGKWWGRKPLILARAAILGCLIPASDNPQRDTEIFLKLLSMDEHGLLQRKDKKLSAAQLYEEVCSNRKLHKYRQFFDLSNGKPRFDKGAPKNEIEEAVFHSLGYDEKIALCKRPEQTEVTDEQTWKEINFHLGTSAHSLQELVQELSLQRFGHNAVVGDCFCGGGSIPFEAARIGCDAYGSDLNPVAALLTWASIHIAGANAADLESLSQYLEDVYAAVDNRLIELGVETNEHGDRALNYVYCSEIICPECGVKAPLIPSLILGKKTNTVVTIQYNDEGEYSFDVKMGATPAELEEHDTGTIVDNNFICPHCHAVTPISAIRHDMKDERGNTLCGLREWGREDYTPAPRDVFQERLYAVKYQRPDGTWYHRAPNKKDIENEAKVIDLVGQNIHSWQKQGNVPSMEIEAGYNTSQIMREKGWKYWHQLFTPRQILLTELFVEEIENTANNAEQLCVGILGLNRMVNWNSKLSRWSSAAAHECGLDTFYNQALNTLFNYSTRALYALKATWFFSLNNYPIATTTFVTASDARAVDCKADIWITDPPYADAVNYHELSEFFLAWDKKLLMKAFPDWYADSKRILAVRGDDHFSKTMIEIYSNLTKHMPDNGMQVVMFTHSDPAVWAQLAVIMWKAGLKVTAAWNIATETDASGLKNGNYVKGTVLLVLRKQTDDSYAFLDEINADIRSEVRNQIASMQALDDKEEPNFGDPDYVLAAYAASLKVLTSYASIEDLDLDYELNQAISNPGGSKIVGIIENAKKIAYDCVIPLEFSSFLWRDLSNAEKFYIKGLESEKRGDYQISTYQEFARGFSIGGYSQLMACEKANLARLKTPYEMGGRTFGEVPDFENSLMRIIFHGIYVGIKEEMNPQKALGFVKNELADYWDRREMIRQILLFIVDVKDISNMQSNWGDCAYMADLLLAAVTHDGV